MRHRALAALIGGAFVAAPSVVGAAVDLTAVGIRIGDHPATARVVVDFAGGRLDPGPIMATDPDPYSDGRIRVVVPARNAQARAPTARGAGVTARVLQGANRVTVAVSGARRRFKYAGYRVLHGGERLVIDLFKSAPRGSGAVARYGRPGCLALGTIAVRPPRILVTGTERDVFEHSFPVRVRSATGRAVGQSTVSAAAGRWRANVRFRVTRPQTGTLEAVELSAKDGALACLAQAPVRLRP